MTTLESTPAAEPDGRIPRRIGVAPLLVYLLLGIFFGILLIKSEVVSWFRIQEMFRFQGFHMYGILGSAVLVAGVSLQLIKRLKLRTLSGDLPNVPPKELGGGYRYWMGGTTFGLGWAMTGACPGPIVALIGYGVTPFIAVFGAALVGTWSYGMVREKLPE